MPEADLAFVGGTVVTVDGRFSLADAVAVTGDRIAAVGSDAEIAALVGPATRTVDVAGGAVLPGINDSHLHAAMLGAYWPHTWLGGDGAAEFPMPRELRTPAERRAAILRACEVVASLGVTSYTEPGLGPGAAGQHGGACAEPVLAAYRSLAAEGRLSARVNVLRLYGELDGVSRPEDLERGLAAAAGSRDADPGRLRVRGVKLFADGIPPMRSAWMSRAYQDGGCGGLLVAGGDEEERLANLRAMVLCAHCAGYQVGVHATGDRAIEAACEALADAMTSYPRDDPRHYVIHGDCVSRETLALMARHGIGLNAQPRIRTATVEALTGALGADRAANAVPLRSTVDSGVPLCLSSDGPVLSPDWRLGVADAASRANGTGERITVAEALRAYTIDGARQDHAESWKGSIEVGKIADLCVLAANPLAVAPEEVPGLEVRMTLLGGSVIFDGASAASHEG